MSEAIPPISKSHSSQAQIGEAANCAQKTGAARPIGEQDEWDPEIREATPQISKSHSSQAQIGAAAKCAQKTGAARPIWE
jgi:hypothetical protein